MTGSFGSVGAAAGHLMTLPRRIEAGTQGKVEAGLEWSDVPMSASRRRHRRQWVDSAAECPLSRGLHWVADATGGCCISIAKEAGLHLDLRGQHRCVRRFGQRDLVVPASDAPLLGLAVEAR